MSLKIKGTELAQSDSAGKEVLGLGQKQQEMQPSIPQEQNEGQVFFSTVILEETHTPESSQLSGEQESVQWEVEVK